jgi:hypothetical protein
LTGRITTWPFSATGRSRVACTPSIALCGGLMIGVDSIEPKTPPLEIENVPPVNSSIVSFPSCARLPKSAIRFSISANVSSPASRRMGTTSPRGLATAMPMS